MGSHQAGSLPQGFGWLVRGFHATRLETRTKESNMYASLRVLKPRRLTATEGGLNESEGREARSREGEGCIAGRFSTGGIAPEHT